MRNNKHRSFRSSLLQSLKQISDDCYELTLNDAVTQDKIYACKTERSIGKISKLKNQNLTFKHRPSTVTMKSLPQKGYMSQNQLFSPLLKRRNSLGASNAYEELCRKVYEKRIEETNSKKNKRQQMMFVSRLSNSLKEEKINLTNYQIGHLGIKQICSYLNSQRCSELILDKNPLGDEGMNQIQKIMYKLNIKKLSLGSVGMTEKGCNSLLISLANTKTLQYLNLCSYQGSFRNKLHQDALKNIDKILKNRLVKLILSNTGLDDHSLINLCEAIKKGCFLQSLLLDHNDITEVGMEKLQQSLVRVQLIELDISKNKILGGGLLEMGTLIGRDYNLTKISKSLKILKMCGSDNRKNTIGYFCKSMERNQILEELHIDEFSNLYKDYTDHIAYFLRRNWTLKKLSMRHSIELVKDCYNLLNSVKQHRGILHLILSNNNIQLQIFKCVIEAMAENKTIKILDLKCCNITDSYLMKCQGSLMKTKLQKLHLDHNLIHDNGAEVLQRLTFKNKLIQQISLIGNSISQKILEHIKKALQSNSQTNKISGPDLSYYQNMQQINMQQKDVLLKSVLELKEREKKLKYRHLLHHIAKKQLQNHHTQKQIQKQAQQIQRISQLKQNLNKMNYYRMKMTQIQQPQNKKQQTFINTNIQLQSSQQDSPQFIEINSSNQLSKKQSKEQ